MHLFIYLLRQTSIIITSNKNPEDWGDILGDPAITTHTGSAYPQECRDPLNW